MTRLSFLLLACFSAGACSQSDAPKTKAVVQTRVGGSCEGCEAIYESPVPLEQLNEVDTLPDFNEPGPKLTISGIVYQSDGKTPAPGAVLYVYHTDQTGKYTPAENATGWARRHGRLRGWLKTNNKGEYSFYTLKPAPYPNTAVPAHIHPTVKESDKNEYYLDEYHFDDDKFLTAEERKKEEGRGGSGVIHLTLKDGMLYGRRDIYLGKNIPDYAKQ